MHDAVEMLRALSVKDDERVSLFTKHGKLGVSNKVIELSALEGRLDQAEAGVDLYVTTASFGPLRARKMENVIGVNALTLDVDIKEGGFATQEAAETFIDEMSSLLDTKPRTVVHSGGGLQPHWLLAGDETRWDQNDAEARNRWQDAFRQFGKLAQHIAKQQQGALDVVFSLEHVWRAPGTLNYKLVDPRRAYVLQDNPDAEALTYDDILEAVEAYLPPPKKKTKASKAQAEVGPGAYQGWVAGTLKKLAAELDELNVGGEWNNTCIRKAFRLRELAECEWCPLTLEEAEEFLVDHMPTDRGFTESDVRGMFAAAENRPGRGNLPEPPVLLASGGYVDEEAESGPNVTTPSGAWAWCQAHLGEDESARLYNFNGSLVYVDREGKIDQLSTDGLKAHVTGCYKIVKVPGKESGSVRKDALLLNEAAAMSVASPKKLNALRLLAGVVTSPVVREDGSLLQAPGYDPETRLLYVPGKARVRLIAESPSRKEVNQAVDLLDYMLQDFDWVHDDDRANYLGLMLLPLLKASSIPFKMGLIDAHQPGSGKTFLARALITLHGGALYGDMPREDAEITKHLGSVMEASTAQVIVFDNIMTAVKAPGLASLLSSPDYKARRLGSSTTIDVKNDRLWIATGNNIQVGGDLGRRVLHVQLDPGVPNPHQRNHFVIKHFQAWVRENREELLWALLTVIRAWYVAGAPLGPPRGADDYLDSATKVDGILRHIGVAGVFDNPAATITQDAAEEQWGVFLQAVFRICGAEPFALSRLLESVVLDNNPELRETRLMYDELPDELTARHRVGVEPTTKMSKSLGMYCKHRTGRWEAGLCIVNAGLNSNKTRLWQVVEP